MSPSVVFAHKEIMNSYGHDSDACPDYEAVVSRSNSHVTTASRNVRWASSEEGSVAPLKCATRPAHPGSMDSPTGSIRRPGPPLLKRERYVYTYNLLAPGTPLQFLISIFPGKSSIPAGSLYSLRVWLRVNGIDHRLFSDDELWVGKDLDFHSIADASFVRLKSVDSKSQVYHGFAGRALVTFTCRWHHLSDNLYNYSLDYEANGVGANLFEDLQLRIDGDPRAVTFLIYCVPISSIPAGSSHRIRVWLKSLVNLSASTPSALPFHDSYIYQRIWKSDNFKIGARLDFEAMSNKTIMGFSAGAPVTVETSVPLPLPRTPQRDIGASSHFVPEKAQRGYQ